MPIKFWHCFSMTYSNKAICHQPNKILNEKLKSPQKYNFPLLQEHISESSLKILGLMHKSIFLKIWNFVRVYVSIGTNLQRFIKVLQTTSYGKGLDDI